MQEWHKKEKELTLVKLNIEDLKDIMALQNKVFDKLDNKEIFAKSTCEEFKQAIKGLGQLSGYRTSEGQLVGLGAYIAYGYNEHNYGYDLEFEGERLLAGGQIETIIVDPDYRGRGLQRKLCGILEDFAKAEGKKYMMATVSPLNPYSLNNFLAIGYETKKEKLKYGGLRRYILLKDLA